MRALVQRVGSASVEVNGEIVGQADRGVLILLGVSQHDDPSDCVWLARKVVNLRIFPDEQGQMNRSLLDEGLDALVVSQFTLYGDCRKGRRPSYVHAARPERAEPLYRQFCQELRTAGVQRVEEGVFGAMMQVSLVNDGPVTLWVESPTRQVAQS
ncbi:MAG: D-aminoacyl-tRNA deacylase [Myxococcota bacterium]|jgi:D-tyrosyl-tRNA(Tyr) deacylase|nr:D-aminoacyl-tRNA deacylase [Myxococcota bacterium]